MCNLLNALTGIVLCCHGCARVVECTHSNDSDAVRASRLEVVQKEPVVYNDKGTVNGGHHEPNVSVHAPWIWPGKVDGLHSLRVYCNGTWRIGN